MASFYAELTVAGFTYPVRRCAFGFSQATDARGRVQARVRHELLHLTLDVPASDQLLAWAQAAHQPLAGHVTFFETNRRTARETVSFEAGQCVGYEELFLSGDGDDGAYVCRLIVTSAGLVLAPGGPAGAFVAPAARAHAVAVAKQAPVATEASGPVLNPLPEAGQQDITSRGAANQPAFHPLEPQPRDAVANVFGQATGYTCVAASLRMILEDKQLMFSEADLAAVLDTSSYGASIMDIPEALSKLQVADKLQAAALRNGSFADLSQALQGGGQAIVSVNIPGLGNHALIVDAIDETHVYIRDPLPLDEGSAYKIKISDFEAYWNKRAVLITS